MGKEYAVHLQACSNVRQAQPVQPPASLSAGRCFAIRAVGGGAVGLLSQAAPTNTVQPTPPLPLCRRPRPEEIGVITPFRKQVQKIRAVLAGKGLQAVKVGQGARARACVAQHSSSRSGGGAT